MNPAIEIDAAVTKSYAAQALEEVGRVSHITQQTLKLCLQSTAPSSVQIVEILDSLLVLFNGNLPVNNISVHFRREIMIRIDLVKGLVADVPARLSVLCLRAPNRHRRRRSLFGGSLYRHHAGIIVPALPPPNPYF